MDISLPLNDRTKMTVGDTVLTYSKQLFSFIKGKTKTTEDAEDILQEVWYQLSRIANLDDLENVSAWLYTVSRNKITDLYRKKSTDAIEDYTVSDDAGNIDIKGILLADDSHNPELALYKDTFWHELMKALDELPENQRQVFVANEFEDKTLQKIADELQLPLKTIISRKGYAVKHIRKRLLPLYRDFENS